MSRKHKNQKTSSALADVVIVTGGRWDFLKECLNTLVGQQVNVILIDNASPMDERQQNEDLFSGTRGARFNDSVGFASANNYGAKMGHAPYILFLNDDCILKSDAIGEMLKTMQDPSVGIVGAKLMFPLMSAHPNRPAGKIQHIGIALNIRGDVIHPLVGWSSDNPRTCQSRDVWGVTGACMMVRRNLFVKVGGFDTIYGAGTYEDADLCLKVRSLGYKIVLNANAQGYHYAGATAEKKQVNWPLQYNSMVFKSKWLGSPLMAWATPDPNSWVGEIDFW